MEAGHGGAEGADGDDRLQRVQLGVLLVLAGAALYVSERLLGPSLPALR